MGGAGLLLVPGLAKGDVVQVSVVAQAKSKEQRCLVAQARGRKERGVYVLPLYESLIAGSAARYDMRCLAFSLPGLRPRPFTFEFEVMLPLPVSLLAWMCNKVHGWAVGRLQEPLGTLHG